MSKRIITKTEYIERFKEKFGDSIIPNMDEYINTQTPIHFKCTACGHEFMRMPHNCLRSKGCPECNKPHNVKLTTEEFIERAKAIHGDKYDYSEADYQGADVKIKVICHAKDVNGKEHGAFFITPHAHIGAMRSGCSKCSGKFKKDTKTFIEEAKAIHGDKYDYSHTNYQNALSKVEIICPKHGPFFIKPNDHLQGKGCKKCGYQTVREKLTMSTSEFLEKAKAIHGEKYDYSKVQYTDSTTKVTIICPEHGEFQQQPVSHLRGKGCPKCKQSHLENEIMQFLEKQGIEYQSQKKFEWLGNKSIDFFLPQYNIGIECQGKQHFQDTMFGSFKDALEKDIEKKKLCEENGVKLLYFSNLGIEYPYTVFEDKEKILEEILA